MAAVTALAAVACGDWAPEPSGPVTLAFIAGPLSPEVGATYEVRIRATRRGVNAQGVSVHFTAVHGTTSQLYPRTDSAGTATVQWTLGPNAGPQAIEVLADLSARKTLTVTAIAGPPTHLVALTPTDQVRVAGTALSIVVERFDQFGNPAQGAVAFELVEGGGSMSQVAETSVTWRLGSEVGVPQRLDARVGSEPPLSFRVTTIAAPSLVIATQR